MKYTIQKGDTLSGIAQVHLGAGSRWREIAAANSIDDPKTIKPGQVINIPGSYTGDWVQPARRGPLGKIKDWLWGE